MTNENTMNTTSDTTAAVPPAPNGHGVSNSTDIETPQAATAKESAPVDASPSSKKNKNKHKRHPHDKRSVSAPVEDNATAPDQHAAVEPIEPPIEEPAAAPIEEDPVAAQIKGPAPAPIEQASAIESLRLRSKIWTDPSTSKRYLMPRAFMRDVVNGQPVTDIMYAYAMRDDDTKLVTLDVGEWNALPFFYFKEDGPAPRATARPVDVIDARANERTRHD